MHRLPRCAQVAESEPGGARSLEAAIRRRLARQRLRQVQAGQKHNRQPTRSSAQLSAAQYPGRRKQLTQMLAQMPVCARPARLLSCARRAASTVADTSSRPSCDTGQYAYRSSTAALEPSAHSARRQGGLRAGPARTSLQRMRGQRSQVSAARRTTRVPAAPWASSAQRKPGRRVTP